MVAKPKEIHREDLADLADAGVNLFCELLNDNHTGLLDFGVTDAMDEMKARLISAGLWDEEDDEYIGPAVIE